MLTQALSVAAAKAKLTGLVVAAAALGSAAAVSSTSFVPTAGEEAVVTEASPSASPEASPEASLEASPSASPDATTESSPAPSPTATLPPCTGEEKNHGAYVSSVAKDKSVRGRDHGKLVSEAAHSDCGKKAGEEQGEAEESEAPEPEESEDAEAEDGDEGHEDKPAKTNGKHKHGRG